MATQAQIQALIDEIVTDAKYPAIKMNPLLTVLLKSSVSFYTGIVDPTAANDNNSDFRPGSVGLNTVTGRVFVCTDATVGAAVWRLVSLDTGYETAALVDGATNQLLVNTAFARFTGSVSEYTIELPETPYTGKTVNLFFTGAISADLTIKNSGGNTLLTISGTTANLSLTFVCTNSATNAWALISYSQS